MAIDRQAFHEALVKANEEPTKKNEDKAAFQLISLASLLASKFGITHNRDDIIQEVVTRSWQKRHHIATAKGNAFNFFWTVMRNDLFKIIKREKNWSSHNYLNSQLKYEPQYGFTTSMDEIIDMEDYLFTKLDFSLTDYKEPEEDKKEKEKPTWVVHKSGRIKINDMAFASYIVKAYEFLKEKVTVSESEILAFIPTEKKLSDPISYMLTRLQVLAKTDGFRVKLKPGETERVFVFINQSET